jgi:hypothetical protein
VLSFAYTSGYLRQKVLEIRQKVLEIRQKGFGIRQKGFGDFLQTFFYSEIKSFIFVGG